MTPSPFNRYAYVKNNPLKYTDEGYFFKSSPRSSRSTMAAAGDCHHTYTGGLAAGAGGWLGLGYSRRGFGAGDFQWRAECDFRPDHSAQLRPLHFMAWVWFGKITSTERLFAVAKPLRTCCRRRIEWGPAGKFGHGFLSSAFTGALAPGIGGTFRFRPPGQAIAASVVGGTAAELGGGKFQWAVNGASGYAFNSYAHAGTAPSGT